MQFPDIIQKILIWSIPILFAITLHEVAHGWVANKLGDPTAKVRGRLTINPIKHIDLIGTIIVPTILLLIPHVSFIFGWAKPVPVNYQNLRHPRRDMALVAAAGPAANLVMALFWVMITKLGISINHEVVANTHSNLQLSQILTTIGFTGMAINIALMVLNLIPIPPLDGSRIVTSMLPLKAARYYNYLSQVGFLILIILLTTGLISAILRPTVLFSLNFLIEIFDLYAIQRII